MDDAGVLPVYAQLWHDKTVNDKGDPVIALPNSRLQTFVTIPASQTASIAIARPVERLLVAGEGVT